MINSKFARTNKKRQALKNGLARSLILHGKITTTRAKARVTQQMVERLISKGKTASLSHVRYLNSVIGKDSATKLIKEIAPTFVEKNGGYTRIIKTAPRKSDASPMAIVEIIKL